MLRETILIVEDDAATRAFLAERIKSDLGLTVTAASTLLDAGKFLSDRTACIAIILDVGMPDGDGRDFCLRIRRKGHKMPIIMLTGSGSESDVLRGLDAGANDYIAKPFRCKELLARLRAQLRAFENSQDAMLMIGQYVFQPAMKLLYDQANDRRISLTRKEADLLRFLYRLEGRAVSVDVLLHEVWGYSRNVETHTLSTHIYRLRQKMESDPAHPMLLMSVGKGYRLEAGQRPLGLRDRTIVPDTTSRTLPQTTA
jgi:DNA-binding response OmpR family regulator